MLDTKHATTENSTTENYIDHLVSTKISSIGTRLHNERQREATGTKLELAFFLQPFWNKNFDEDLSRHTNSRGHHAKSSNRNDNRASEEGFLLNLKKVIENIKNKEYLFASHMLKVLTSLINNYKKRLEYDERDPSYELVSELESTLEKMNSNDNFKGELRLCCAQGRILPCRPAACKNNGCPLMIEINNTCFACDEPGESLRKTVICQSCYNSRANEGFVEIRKQKKNSIKVEWQLAILPRNSFRRYCLTTDNFEEWEDTVDCLFCANTVHTICALYDYFNVSKLLDASNSGYSEYFRPGHVCNTCIHDLIESHLHNMNQLWPLRNFPKVLLEPIFFSEHSFVKTNISEFMETTLAEYMLEGCARLNTEGLPTPIKVREVCSRRRTFEAKPRMKKEYENAGLPTSWEYHYRSIMVFQYDHLTTKYMAVFNLIVHEYPDRGEVNISYIDSVKLFNPVSVRTRFYKLVVMAYLQCLQRQGKIKKVHLWVCPPIAGDEYVFYGRPRETHPKNSINGLIKWYQLLLTTCKEKNVITDFSQIGPDNNPYNSHLDIPYHYGDFWIERLETMLEQHEKESSRPAGKSGRNYTRSYGKGKTNHYQSQRQPSLQDRMDEIINTECRNVLFCATLADSDTPQKQFTQIKQEPGTFNENDEELDIICPYMGTRENFLVDCRENKMDFSDRRKAIHATMVMFSRMAQESASLGCKGPSCTRSIDESGWYCIECEDPVFCGVECGTAHAHKVHKAPPRIRKFRVPLINEERPEPGQVACAGNFISQVLLQESQTLTLLLENAKKGPQRGSKRYCWSLIPRMFALGYDDNKTNQAHRSSCDVCDKIWVALTRHKKVCFGRTCVLPCCSSVAQEEVNQGRREHMVRQDDLARQHDHLPPTIRSAIKRPHADDFVSPIEGLKSLKQIKQELDENEMEPCSSTTIALLPATFDYNINRRKPSRSIKPSKTVIRYSYNPNTLPNGTRTVSDNRYRVQISNSNIVANGYNGQQPQPAAGHMQQQGKFVPLMNFSSPATALSSRTPFTQSIQIRTTASINANPNELD